MKLNLKILKKPSYIIGGIILFFVVLWLVNRSGGSSSTTVASAGGPTDAQVAANAQLQMAQIAAGVQMAGIQADVNKSQNEGDIALAIAQLQANNEAQQNQVNATLGAASIALQGHALDLNYEQSLANNQFALDYAREAYNYSLAGQQLSLQGFEFAQVTSLIQNKPLKKLGRYAPQILDAYGNMIQGSTTPASVPQYTLAPPTTGA